MSGNGTAKLGQCWDGCDSCAILKQMTSCLHLLLFSSIVLRSRGREFSWSGLGNDHWETWNFVAASFRNHHLQTGSSVKFDRFVCSQICQAQIRHMSSSTTSDAIDLLASIFPDRSRASLATALSTHSGSLERTTNALLSSGSTKGSATKRKREAAPASGLGGWLTSLASTTPKQRVKDVIPAGDDGYRRPRVVKGSGSSGANAFTSLKPPPSAAIPSTPTSLPPLNLCTAELIRQHTGGRVELVERVLSKELAARLFLTMVRESQGSDGGAGCESPHPFLHPSRD